MLWVYDEKYRCFTFDEGASTYYHIGVDQVLEDGVEWWLDHLRGKNWSTPRNMADIERLMREHV